MILSCPRCPKTYDVPRAAIPPEGREVACAECGSVWFERGVEATRRALGAGGADVAGVPAQADRPAGAQGDVIDADYAAVGDTAPRPAPATQAALPVASPARARQAVLAAAFAEASGDEPDAQEAVRVLRGVARRRLTAARETALAGLGIALGTALHVAARLRGKPPPERFATPGDLAARATRDRMRAAAANRMTPGRALGWTAWASASAALAFALVFEGPLVRAVFPPSAGLYALRAPPAAPPGLTVEAALGAYALSTQGPAVTVTGRVINAGGADAVPRVTLVATTRDGTEAQDVPLPQVALPPGGERPFALRALVPDGTKGLRVTVAEDPARPDALTLQARGGAWNGHAGPPALGAAPSAEPR